MSETFDPKTHRAVQTKEGLAFVPREQRGTPFAEYFKNAERLPGTEDKLVYVTEKGPVWDSPDPVEWNSDHDKMAERAADEIKAAIDKSRHARYRLTLDKKRDQLSNYTTLPIKQVEAKIIATFTEKNGQDIKAYQDKIRAERGLDRSSPEHDHGPEMTG